MKRLDDGTGPAGACSGGQDGGVSETPADPEATPERSGDDGGETVLVVTPEGMSMTRSDDNLSGLIEQPAKVMRIGSMIKGLLEEVRSAPLDDAGRARLAEVHERSIRELQSGLAPELVDELQRITLPFATNSQPTDAELRVAQAQLVGWLEGLFHGIQTALFAQQMAARAQFEEMRRRALPGGSGMPGQMPRAMPGQAAPQSGDAGQGSQHPGPGQYL